MTNWLTARALEVLRVFATNTNGERNMQQNYGGPVNIGASFQNAMPPTSELDREISTAVRRATDSVEYTRELVAKLAERLSSVLRPAACSDGCGKDAPGPATVLACEINLIVGRSGQTNDFLREILDRLEL